MTDKAPPTKPSVTEPPQSLVEIMLFSMGGPERQEAQGQRELVNSQSLPANVSKRDQWEALGFTFGEPFADDPLFCPATMPAGWSKRPTDHSMWSDIVDPAGNKRGAMFYKAAFYDRNAFMHPPERRFYPDHEDPAAYWPNAAEAIEQ